MNCYTYNGKTLSEEELFTRIFQELDTNKDLVKLSTAVYKIDDVKQEFIKIKSEGEKAQKEQEKAALKRENLPYIAVTKYITAVHFPSKKQLTPEYVGENRKAKWISDHLEEFNGNRTDAEKAFDEEIYYEEENNKLGSYIHELTNVLLEHTAGSDEYRKKIKEIRSEIEANNFERALILTAKDVDSKTSTLSAQEKADRVIKHIEITSKQLSDWVHSAFPNCDIFSEIPMVLKKQQVCSTKKDGLQTYKGIIGVADLIAVNKTTGEISLVDYKISGRKYSDWTQAKLNEVDYQVALYRAMLSEFGFDGNKIKIYIKPVLFEKQNISSLSIQDETIDRLAARDSGASRIGWKGGKFTSELRDLGLGQKLSYDKKNDTKLSEIIEQDLENTITFEDPVLLSREWMIDNKLESDKDDLGNIKGYKMWSSITSKYIKAPTKEEFIKEGGLIDVYIDELITSRNNISKTIISNFIKYKKERDAGKDIKDLDFLDIKNVQTKRFLQNKLGRYVNNGWDFEPVSDELLDKGILLFSKTDSKTGEKIIEIVSIAQAPLLKTLDINGTLNVLGKYVDNELVKKLPFNVLSSEYRNVKSVETMVILNSLLKCNPDIFQNCVLGNLLILNPKGTSSEYHKAKLRDLIDNFNFLCEHGNIENFLKDIKTLDRCDSVMQEAFDLLTPLCEDKTFKQILTDIDHNSENINLQRKGIEALLKYLLDQYPDKLIPLSQKGARFDNNDKVQVAYMILSDIFASLNNMQIDYTGRSTQYGISVSELFSFFGVLITGKLIMTDTDGDKISGFANGLDTSSPRMSPSDNLKQLNGIISEANSKVKQEFNDKTTFLSKLNRDFATKMGGSRMLISSSYLSVWERLLVHENGKISKEMLVKNPYDKSNDLLPEEREYLKQWLWEVNKWKLNQPDLNVDWHYKGHESAIESNQEIQNMMADGTYFQFPLVKSESYQRTRALVKNRYSLKDYFMAKWKEFEDDYRPNGIHNIRREQIRLDKNLWMYNEYDITQAQRKELLNSESYADAFSFDFDYVSLDVAFNNMRKKYYDEVILLHQTVMALMTFVGQNTNADFDDEKETAINLLKILKGESILTKGQEKITKFMVPVRQLNSVALLACRPVQMLKELSFGLFINYSRAWNLKLGRSSNAVTFNDVFEASSILWGQRITKWGKSLVGEGALTDFYLCERLNSYYRIANEDLIRTTKNASISGQGMVNNASRWMYIAQSAPDYYNRMTLFLAKMIRDGCYKAHSLNENGELIYDWKKDDRFSELAKHGLNSNYYSEKYQELKALYVKMCEEFKDPDLIKWDSSQRKYIYGDLKLAYTWRQRDSIKEVSDLAYGFYDHETKSLINHKFVGLAYLQFQTYLSALYNRWFKGSTAKGKNTAQGKFVFLIQNGVKYYNKHIVNEDGNYVTTELVPETSLTEEEKRTLIPAMKWEGDFVEGMAYSIMYTMHDLFTLNWKDAFNNKQRLANCFLALHDLFFGVLMVNILKTIFSGGSGKMQDIDPLKRVLIRGMQDVGPLGLTQVSITPSFIKTLLRFKADGAKLLTGSDNLGNILSKELGAIKDFTWNEN